MFMVVFFFKSTDEQRPKNGSVKKNKCLNYKNIYEKLLMQSILTSHMMQKYNLQLFYTF